MSTPHWTDPPSPSITAAIADAEARLQALDPTDHEPLYLGFKGLDGSFRAFVASGQGAPTPLRVWGYFADTIAWGSDTPPASELAFAILLDYIGDWPNRSTLYKDGHMALTLNAWFCSEFVQGWRADQDWWLRTTDITVWLQSIEQTLFTPGQ